MATSFKDIAPNLRTKPSLRWVNGNDIDRLWIVEETQPVQVYSPYPEVLPKSATKVITPAAGATAVSTGTHAFGITGPWGSTFTVAVITGAANTTSVLSLPAGTTQAQLIAALYERMGREADLSPSIAANGGLAVFSTATGTEAVTAAPSPFTLASSAAKFLKPGILPKYRRGAAHPECAWLKVHAVESSGRDDHHVNLTIFYRVDLDALMAATGGDPEANKSRAGYEITEPYDTFAYPSVRWTFEILNPEEYNRPANGTPHPWVPGAALVNETRTEQEGAHLITRIYMTLPGLVLETPIKAGNRYSKILTKAVWTTAPGSAPTATDYTNLSEKCAPDQQHPAVSLWTVEAEKFPGPVVSSKKTEGTRELHTITRRFLDAANTSAPSAPVGTIQLSKDPKQTDNDLVREWVVECEKLPGPIGYETEEDGDQNVEVAKQRVAADSMGTEPPSEIGGTKLSTKVNDTENDLIAEWEIRYLIPRAHSDNSEAKSGSAEGVQTSTAVTSLTKVAPIGDEVSLRNDVETRGKDGAPLTWKASKEKVTAAAGVISRQENADAKGVSIQQTTVTDTATAPTHSAGQMSFSATVNARNTSGTPIQYKTQAETLTVSTGTTDFDVTYKPGYTLRKKTDTVTGLSGEGASDADYTYQIAAKDLDGNPLAYKEQITLSTATPRVAGNEKEEKPMVTLTTVERYDTSPTVTSPTGSSALDYVDKHIAVYRLRETTAVGKERSIGTNKDAGPGYVLLSAESYSLDNTITTPQGQADIAFDDGTVTVYKKSQVTLESRPMTAGTEKDVRPMVDISTVKRYDAAGIVGTPVGTSRIVKTDGEITIYEVSEQTSTGKERSIGTSKNVGIGYTELTDESYSLNNSIATRQGSVDIAYDDGQTTVYKKGEVRLEANPTTAGTEKDERPMVSLSTLKRYDATGEITTPNGSSRLIKTDGVTKVFEISEVTSTGKERSIGTSKDQRVGISIATAESYSLTNTLSTPTGNVGIAFDDGQTVVYKKDEKTLTVNPITIGQERDIRPMVEIVTTKRIDTTGTISTATGSSRITETDGVTSAHEISEVTSTGRPRIIGTSKDARVGYTLATQESYSLDNALGTAVGSVGIAYDDGQTTVYKKDEVTATPSALTFVSGKSGDLLTETSVTTRYSTSPAGLGTIYNTDAVFTDGGTTIYKVDETEITPKDAVVYDTLVHTTVPPVLRSVNVLIVPAKSGSGYGDKTCVFIDMTEGYTGSFAGRVTRYFTKTAPASGTFVPILFRPSSITFDGVYVNLSVPACLHGLITFTEVVGTNDPNFDYTVVSWTYNQTGDYTDIPAGYVPFSRDVEVYRDGFMVTDTEVKYR